MKTALRGDANTARWL